jgi:HEPN domain-containing protein
MIDVLNALLDDESQGIKFKGTDKELEFLQKQLGSRIFDQNSISSLENAIALFRKGSYTDAVRIFFPSIEAVANRMLSEAGEAPNDYKKYKGLADKLKKLEELKLISTDLAMAIDITTSRNKVLHGQYEPLEQEYSYPICVASIIYLRRMLNEFEKVKTKGGSN